MQKHTLSLIVFIGIIVMSAALFFETLDKLPPGIPASVVPVAISSVTPEMPTRTPVPPPASVVTPHLVLSVISPSVLVGALFTLHIAYHNVGLPYTTVLMDPDNLAVFDPPRTMPCKYNEDPTWCGEISFRARAPGVVTFTAGATGEVCIYCSGGTTCCGWTWAGGGSIAPAIVTIEGKQVFLPVVRKKASG